MSPRHPKATLGIAIPSLNQVDYVVEAIRSIQALEVPFTALVRDAGSTDGTIDAIESAIAGDDRFDLRVQPDSGQANAINLAFKELADDHPLLAWVNTDDRLVAAGMHAAVDKLLADRSTVAAFGDFAVIDGHGDPIGEVRRPRKASRRRLLHHYNTVPGVGIVIRTSAIEQVGWLDESLRYAFDYDLWLRLLEVGDIRKVDAVAAEFRWHSAAKTSGEHDRSEAEAEGVAARHRTLGPTGALVVRSALRVHGRVMRATGRWREVDLTDRL